METWNFESWRSLATGQVAFSRDTGALMHLSFALNYLARTHILAGDLTAAARLVEEDHLIAEAVGHPPIADTAMMLAAWQGREQEAAELIEAISREATAHGADRLVSLAAYAGSVLYNGLGRSAAACDAARRAFEREPMGYGSHIVPELAEAAARTGDRRCWRPRSTGCQNAPAPHRPSGCWGSRPGSAPCSARATRPSGGTASRSSG